MVAKTKPNKRCASTSVVIPVTASSDPPLKPIEKSKYNAIKPLDAAGISRSLLTTLATTPNKKNNNVGLVKLKMSNSKLFINLFNTESGIR